MLPATSVGRGRRDIRAEMGTLEKMVSPVGRLVNATGGLKFSLRTSAMHAEILAPVGGR